MDANVNNYDFFPLLLHKNPKGIKRNRAYILNNHPTKGTKIIRAIK